MLTTAMMAVAMNALVFTIVASFSCSKKAKPGNKTIKPQKIPRMRSFQNLRRPQSAAPNATSNKTNAISTVNKSAPAKNASKMTRDMEDKTQSSRSSAEIPKSSVKSAGVDRTQGSILKSSSEMNKNNKANKLPSEKEEEVTLKSAKDEDDTQISASYRMADSEDTNEFIPDLKQDGNLSELDSIRNHHK